jgi:2-dehydro-3-deoxygluconokinase
MTGRPASGAPSFIALGECMIEMAQQENGLYRRGFAGDTFNAAWYARRLLPADWSVSYGTCVGEDAASDEMTVFMADEGVALDAIRRIPGRTVGLYMIDLTEGERSFSYWRGQSAARLLGEDAAWLERVLAGRRVVHFSGITLAILPPEGRRRLCDAVAKARAAGALTAFDTNLRPLLWEDEAAMRDGLMMGAAAAEIVLPSFDEEQMLFDDSEPDDTVARYREAGARLVAVKNGPEPLTLWRAGREPRTLAPVSVEPVDTTAAGDSFAAALLAGLALGRSAEESVEEAMALAARVVGHRGALARGLFGGDGA